MSYEGFEARNEMPDDYVFTNVDEEGNIVVMDIKQMEEEVKQEVAEKELNE